jgi:hypothetical protein
MTIYCVVLLLFTLIHFRSLGVHVSKVRSLNLDDWEPESIKVNILKMLDARPGFIIKFLKRSLIRERFRNFIR